jgi:hypothetical protein
MKILCIGGSMDGARRAPTDSPDAYFEHTVHVGPNQDSGETWTVYFCPDMDFPEMVRALLSGYRAEHKNTPT